VTAIPVGPGDTAASSLFPDGVHAVNVGLAMFADPPRGHGASVLALDWRPAAGADRGIGLLVARLDDDTAVSGQPGDEVGQRVAAANGAAVERILAARPVLVDVRPARDAIPFLGGSGRALLQIGRAHV